ncbi:MAG: DUF502 domain-containing protein [Draconibacterium sp.]|nr:DUF502 domain-containing protein [Draconibacterium sp.]
MKNVYSKIKSTFISGIILFLPLFILAAILQKVYTFMFGFGHKITGLLGLEKEFAPILTTALVILLFLIFGLLVRFSMVTKMKDWIENNLLVYIPTYSKYKAKMMAKLQPGVDLRQPVLVEMNGSWNPGLLITETEDKSTVFMPTSPDTDYGEVWVVKSVSIQHLAMTTKELKTSLLLGGKGLSLTKS